jgi:hypothetical protein
MRRTICKWYLSRSIDTRQPVPARIQGWIDRDPVLKDYQSRVLELENRLRSDASRMQISSEARNETRMVMRKPAGNEAKGFYMKAAAIAAAVLIFVGAGGAMLMQSGTTEIADRDSARKPQLNKSGELAKLKDTIKQLVDKNQDKIKQFADKNRNRQPDRKFMEALAILAPEPGTLDQKLSSAFRNLAGSPVAASFESTGQVMRTTLTAGDEGLSVEASKLASDLRQGAQYFTKTLPDRFISPFKDSTQKIEGGG